MPDRDVVVVGASAGGVEALQRFVAGLPSDLPATVLVVLHMPATSSGGLADILCRYSALPVQRALDGEPLVRGRIVVAVPDQHLLVRSDRVVLSRSARQNRVRPAVDALFRSAARWCGSRVIAVVLSGARDDGAAGAAAIRARGGSVVVQDPDDAIFAGMPRAALAAVDADAVVDTAGRLGARVVELTRKPTDADAMAPDRNLILETDMAESDLGRREPIGEPAGLGCPDCNGGISVVGSGGTLHYRCHVGHSYSPQTLLDAQREKVEKALWTSIGFLEEQAMIHENLAARARSSGASITQDNQLSAADDARQAAAVLRDELRRIMGALQ